MQPQYHPAPRFPPPQQGAGGIAQGMQSFATGMGTTMQLMEMMQGQKKRKAIDKIMDGAQDRPLNERELMAISRLDPKMGKELLDTESALKSMPAQRFSNDSKIMMMMTESTAQLAMGLKQVEGYDARLKLAQDWALRMVDSGMSTEFIASVGEYLEDSDLSDQFLDSMIATAEYGLERVQVAARIREAESRENSARLNFNAKKVNSKGELWEIAKKEAANYGVSVLQMYGILNKEARGTGFDEETGEEFPTDLTGQKFTDPSNNRIKIGSPGDAGGRATGGGAPGQPTPADAGGGTPASGAPATEPPKTTSEALSSEAGPTDRPVPASPARMKPLPAKTKIPKSRQQEIRDYVFEGQHVDLGRKARKRGALIKMIESGDWDLVHRKGQLYLQNIHTLKEESLGIKKKGMEFMGEVGAGA